jgi:hypothetical protein
MVEQDLEDWAPLLGWLRAKEEAVAQRSADSLEDSAHQSDVHLIT